MKKFVVCLVCLISVSSWASHCDLRTLKGTYSFIAVGTAPTPPQDVLATPVSFGSAIPLHAVGSVVFDGKGNHKGYIQESVGGVTEMNVPFEGTYQVQVQMDDRGCMATWTLQDHHTLAPFVNEPPHVFKLAIAQESKSFYFLAVAGGPGPITISGEAKRAD